MGPTLTWNAAAVRALRRALGENTRTFGAKVGRTGRTVQSWEEGKRNPDRLVGRLLTARARKLVKAGAVPRAQYDDHNISQADISDTGTEETS